MNVCRVGVCDLAACLHHRADGSSTDLTEPIHQISADVAPSLAEELVEEILLRVPPDEPVHLVRASLVCKAWHSILSDDTFRRRYRSFHGGPTLQGYFYNSSCDSTVRFIPTTTFAAASPICAFKFDGSDQIPSAWDCRHGRVLIEAGGNRRLIVWDPIVGSQQHVSLPSFLYYPCWHNYTGAVLCAKDGCNHLDCHGGPFLIVLVGGTRFDYEKDKDVPTWASVYSSETGVWSSPTTPNDKAYQYIDDMRQSLLIGDALYYTTISIYGGYNIVKYDLCKHELSVMDLPVELKSEDSILIKGNDRGIAVAAILHNCIYMWLWKVDNKGVGAWVKYRVMELDGTLLSEGDLICTVEGTNTVIIGVKHTGVFTLDLLSRQVRKIGETDPYNSILPCVSFSAPKY